MLNYLKNLLAHTPLLPSASPDLLEEYPEFSEEDDAAPTQGDTVSSTAVNGNGQKPDPSAAPIDLSSTASNSQAIVPSEPGPVSLSPYQLSYLDAESQRSYQYLATMMGLRGRLNEATVYYRRVMGVSGGNGAGLKSVLPSFWRQEAERSLQQAEAAFRQGNWQEAIAHCQEASVILPDLAPAYKVWGNALQRLGRLAEAKNRYEKALELDPQFAEVHANLGSLFAQQQEWSAAVRSFQRAIALKPDFAGAFRNLARSWAQLDKPRLAADCRYRAMVLDPEMITAAEALTTGDELRSQERLAEAEQCYRRALALDEGLAAAHQGLAEVLSRQDNWQESVVHYRKAILLNAVQPKGKPGTPGELPSTPPQGLLTERTERSEAKVSWESPRPSSASKVSEPEVSEPESATSRPVESKSAETPTSEGDRKIERAIQACLRELAQHPESAELHTSLGNLYAQQRHWDEAIAHYHQAIALQPTQAEVHRNLARVLALSGRRDEATVQWFEAVKLAPDWAKPEEKVSLGDALLKLEREDEAIACFRWAIRQEVTCAVAYQRLAAVLMEQGSKDEAIALYQQLLEHCGEDGEALFQLGQVAFEQEQWQEAIGYFERTVKAKPDHWYAHHQLGDSYTKLERWEDAVKGYKGAIALNNDFSWSHNNLGDALMKLERWEDAAEAYRRAIELNPDFVWSHYNLGEVLTSKEHWSEAVEAYRVVHTLQPDLPCINQRLADGLYQKAKTDQGAALEFYHLAIHENPDDEQNYFKALDIKSTDIALHVGLGGALVRKGQLDKAIASYQIALQLQPDHIEVTKALEEVIKRKARLQDYNTSASSGDYALWLKENSPTSEDFSRMAKTLESLSYQPLISIIMPTYNTPEPLLREAIQSVQDQVYSTWELCIADDASTQESVRAILAEFAEQDARIKVVFREKNGHISASSNSALELATGDYVALLDHDDVLTPDALFEVVALLNEHPEADMIYSDEDKLNEQGQRSDPFFKPDWCPDSFLSRMYTCHLGVYRRALVDQVSGFRVGYEGAQDYDLVLRLTEITNHIFHIPKVLYHWRVHSTSTANGAAAKPYAFDAGRKALEDALVRRYEPGKVIQSTQYAGSYIIRYEIAEHKLVSIIIPTRNLGTILNTCLKSIFDKSTYPNYEVILIDNGSDEQETLDIIKAWESREPNRFKCYDLDIPFNYSRINNYAVEKAKGDYLLFLNNDTEVITPDWIEAMVEQAQRPSSGAVGALLFYPDDTIQHAGVVVGLGGVAGHSHKHFPRHSPGYVRQLLCVNNYSAVTAACLMCRREVFEEVNGFDESLKVAFNDIDLCLKIESKGYNNLCLPHVSLYHYESKSRGYEDTPEKQRRFQQEVYVMKQKWGSIIEHDPCYSPNLTRDREDYSINVKTCVEVTSVILSDIDFDLFWGFHIDSPVVGVSTENSIKISGWIIGKQSRISSILVVSNQNIIRDIPVDMERKDVASLYQDVEQSQNSGFSVTINVADLPKESRLEINTLLGDTVFCLGVVNLKCFS
ncbi:MAG: tetratricopeptide repeat protein [Synechococcales bacterium]|nr:tetratricopeptide repeat protein [Synechococcales bacterium]